MVPIVRDADRSELREIEKEIADYAKKAREGTIAIEDLTGGTFTITNGGVFGSLMSTPIVNSRRAPFWACTRSRSGRWSSTARSSSGR